MFCICVLMTLSFLAGDALEIVHLCGLQRRSNEAQVVNLCCLASRLVVLHKNLDVLYILEFHVTEVHRVTLEVLLGEAVGKLKIFISGLFLKCGLRFKSSGSSFQFLNGGWNKY